MITFRALLATGALLGLTATAQARDAFSVTGMGENFAVEYAPGYSGNIVGGGSATQRSSGESGQILYSDATAARRTAGVPTFVGGNEGDVVYQPVPVRGTTPMGSQR